MKSPALIILFIFYYQTRTSPEVTTLWRFINQFIIFL